MSADGGLLVVPPAPAVYPATGRFPDPAAFPAADGAPPAPGAVPPAPPLLAVVPPAAAGAPLPVIGRQLGGKALASCGQPSPTQAATSAFWSELNVSFELDGGIAPLATSEPIFEQKAETCEYWPQSGSFEVPA
ncbi:MAG TPA: hypothetical protein VHU80_24715 [Polyangiaceae bacterium]|nr:hypothetical protein [Polyangiaceae bacterium]